ncbi:MAG: DUF1517 domain-containing protein [Synechococcus sp. SB0665_bin_28]|nr:DUF1517 domain-containing protein [Synechococcus sp. SB0665_bin_28]MYF20446.1 DUF1517 domain-containing protein [Synechococcus sp. SB0677_bin_5]MYK85600.1 DUF1517 domain-containing protein [Synechococcus sp. SB0669_bin_7]
MAARLPSSHHPHRPQRLLQDVTLALPRNPEYWVYRHGEVAKWASPWRRPPSIASR